MTADRVLATDDGQRVQRLFVGVWPPPEVRSVLLGLPRPAERGVRWVVESNWHVTLRFVGSARPDDVRTALDGVRLPRVTAELGPVVSRLGRDMVVIPVAGVDELAAAVRDATAGVGRGPEAQPFTGHLTLARLRHRAACGVTGAPVRMSFEVDHVALVSSVTAPEGAQYRELHRWPTVPR